MNLREGMRVQFRIVASFDRKETASERGGDPRTPIDHVRSKVTLDWSEWMPANIGEMFYTGAVPWHGLGIEVAKPVTVEETLKVGGLNWPVGEVDLT